MSVEGILEAEAMKEAASKQTYLYDETYQVLVSAARTKMIMNQHKGMIHEVDPMDLIELAANELFELRDEVTVIGGGDPERIIEEAGDVLNFLVGIVHNAVAAYRSKQTMATSRTEDEAQGQ